MPKMRILQPYYVKNFKCACALCEDICCRDWEINVDEAAYQKYTQCADFKLRKALKENIVRKDEDLPAGGYKIKLNDNNVCPFLDKDKLCSLQREFGEEYLSILCVNYPRVYHTIDGVLEKSLCLSCPQAANLALLNSAPMEFELSEEDSIIDNFNGKISCVFDTNKAKKNNCIQQYFWDIRTFSISLVQNRDYPLWQRLIILGLFSQNLNKLLEEDNNSGVLPLIEEYNSYLSQGVFKESLKDMPAQIKVQANFIKELLLNKIPYIKSERFKECFDEAASAVNFVEKSLTKELENQYVCAYENYYKPLANKHEYILENYFVNQMFQNLFPFGGEPNFFDNYITLIINYAAIKTILIGMAGFHKENFDISHMLKAIQACCKSIGHDGNYQKSILETVKDNKLNTMHYMAVFIKN